LQKHSVSTPLLVIGLALVYFAAGKLGLQAAVLNPSASALWPPTGIALAACLLFGYRAWPGVFLGAFLVNVTTSGSIPVSLALSAGNTSEALAGAYLVNRFANGRRVFDQALGVFKFTLLAGVLSTAISATTGVTSLVLGRLADPPAYGPLWLTWWLGDVAGALIVTPVILLWAEPAPGRWLRGRAAEAVTLLATLTLISLLVFGGLTLQSRLNLPLAYLVLPFVVWAGLRFGQHGAATYILVLASIAIWGTLQGLGPFARGNPNQALLLLQGFLGTISITGLALGAVSSSAAAAYRAEQQARDIAERALDRTARLQAVASGLSQLLSPDRVAQVVIEQGVVALGASAGAVAVLNGNLGALDVIGASGYSPNALEPHRRVGLDAPLPVAEAARTGQAVWLESTRDWQARYPQAMPAHRAAGTEAAAAVPIMADRGVVGVLALSFAQPRGFASEEQAFVLALSQHCAQALERARLYAEAQEAAAALEGRVRERTEQLRALTLRLESLREDERSRIAREVHDELGGALTAIKMDISRLQTPVLRAAPELQPQLQSLLALVDASVQTVRRIATDLRPALLDDFGLAAAVEWLLQEYQRRTGIECEARLAPEAAALDPATATALFRVLQEALTNVSRHAQATRVEVSLNKQAEALVLTVRDNGRGFEPAEAARRPSLGLVGMRERVFAIGGHLEIESAPGGGSTVRVTLPRRDQGANAR
jgi:signal transduction histidine kinase